MKICNKDFIYAEQTNNYLDLQKYREKDIKILETLFWPFMSLYDYTELSEAEFLKNLKIIKPWLDEPFQFEIDIHNQLPDDKPEIKDIMPLNEFRNNLKSYWEILNSNKSI